MTNRLAPPTERPLGEVTTERMRLRPFAHDDLDRLAPIFAKEAVWKFPYGRGFTRKETAIFLDLQLAEWNEHGFGCWLAEDLATGHVVGYAGLSVPTFLPEILPAVEVGWRFDPDHWGKGLASEAARAALREGFTTLGLDLITSVPQADNPPSSRVCERIGMRLDREVTIPANAMRGELTGLLYLLTKQEWEASNHQQ
jgi:RimJ/RimL family protein N-acetyltransferase